MGFAVAVFQVVFYREELFLQQTTFDVLLCFSFRYFSVDFDCSFIAWFNFRMSSLALFCYHGFLTNLFSVIFILILGETEFLSRSDVRGGVSRGILYLPFFANTKICQLRNF